MSFKSEYFTEINRKISKFSSEAKKIQTLNKKATVYGGIGVNLN